MALVSIVMPCYNRSKYVAGAIKSCLNQTYKNIELVLVDDASKDDTLNIINYFARNDSRIKVINHKLNYGTATSFNAAIRASKGKYIVMHGSDDYMTFDSIERRVRAFTSTEDLLYGSVKNFYGDKDYEWCESHKLFYQKREVAGHAVMLRRRVFEKYGLFYKKLRRNEDAEYWFRIGLVKLKSGVQRVTSLKYKKVPVVCAYVRLHKGSTVANMSKNIKLKQKTIFRERIRQIIHEGITKKNTEFL